MDELTPMDEIKAIVESKATEEPKTESVAVPIPTQTTERNKQKWLWTLFALTMTAAVLLAILLPCKYFGYIS